MALRSTIDVWLGSNCVSDVLQVYLSFVIWAAQKLFKQNLTTELIQTFFWKNITMNKWILDSLELFGTFVNVWEWNSLLKVKVPKSIKQRLKEWLTWTGLVHVHHTFIVKKLLYPNITTKLIWNQNQIQ